MCPIVNAGDGFGLWMRAREGVAKARNGVLLVDEVEIGLHYSIQVELWRVLVQMALDFQVQIFATTHSEDAIRAFSIATKENEAVAFDGDELGGCERGRK